jgi:hypothetical protein
MSNVYKPSIVDEVTAVRFRCHLFCHMGAPKFGGSMFPVS